MYSSEIYNHSFNHFNKVWVNECVVWCKMQDESVLVNKDLHSILRSIVKSRNPDEFWQTWCSKIIFDLLTLDELSLTGWWLGKVEYRLIPVPQKVPNIKCDFDIRFLTLMHWGKTKRQKLNIQMDKLGRFDREETKTIPT